MASSFASNWLPPRLRDAGNRLLGARTIFKGPYSSWTEAEQATSGYADDAILGRVVEATQRVLSGEPGYEQDGTVRPGTAPPSNALAALLAAAAAEGGDLRVLDFGGGLASHFLRWSPFLSALPSLSWCVVEQANFVQAGTQLFSHVAQVKFATDLNVARGFAPNVVLVSSALQYLSQPMVTLGQLAALDARVVVIDRTPLSSDGRAYILTQHVPSTIGRASYPMWILSNDALRDCLRPRYEQRALFPAADQAVKVAGLRANYIGCVWWRAP